MPKRYSTRDVERVLLARGFTKIGQKDSHVKYGDGVRVVIVVAGRKQIRAGTMSSIARQAGLSLSDFDD
jgi:predicted RNA binding protein YcfA (HicA-like mRNA interferase family)